MSQTNMITNEGTKCYCLGKEFELWVQKRIEKYDSPSSSGFTERGIRPVFQFMTFHGHSVTEDYLAVIDFVEILRGFSGNRMLTKKEYPVPDIENAKLLCTTRPTEGSVFFYIRSTWSKKDHVLLDKIECSQLAAKTNKIINSCAFPYDPIS